MLYISIFVDYHSYNNDESQNTHIHTPKLKFLWIVLSSFKFLAVNQRIIMNSGKEKDFPLKKHFLKLSFRMWLEYNKEALGGTITRYNCSFLLCIIEFLDAP